MTALIFIFETIFIIVGSVIGAGFISGREILSFFNGQNIYISFIILFVFFFIAFYVLLSFDARKNKLLVYFQPIILFGNMVILSGMISAIDNLCYFLFELKTNIPYFSLIFLIISCLVVGRGIDGVCKLNLLLVPLILIFTIMVLVKKAEISNISSGKIAPISCALYVGVNTLMSSKVFIDAGKKLTKCGAILSAIFATLILCLLILFIFLALSTISSKVSNLSMPILYFLGGKGVGEKMFIVIMIFAVLTTLISALYPLFLFAENFQKEKTTKAFIVIIAFVISRFGFGNIVNYLYPILGFFGALYIVISILSGIFLKEPRQST